MWLFIPTPETIMNCAALVCAPASEVSTSDCILPNPPTELCALSSETVSPRPPSWHGWQTRAWHQLLSGTISNPSTADLGAAAFISSLPVIPASPSRSQVSGKAKTIRDTSGQTLPVSRQKSHRNGSSSRTSPGISPLAFRTSPETFRTWATGLQRASYQRRKLAGRIPVKGSSFWPTPTFKGSGNRACILVGPEGLRFVTDLNQSGSQIGIRNATSSWTLFWDILVASGWTPGPFRSSHRARVNFKGGELYSKGGPTLNPAFTDHLMGWPTGWTDPLRPVTGWSHWLRQGRGMLSRQNSRRSSEKPSPTR